MKHNRRIRPTKVSLTSRLEKMILTSLSGIACGRVIRINGQKNERIEIVREAIKRVKEQGIVEIFDVYSEYGNSLNIFDAFSSAILGDLDEKRTQGLAYEKFQILQGIYAEIICLNSDTSVLENSIIYSKKCNTALDYLKEGMGIKVTAKTIWHLDMGDIEITKQMYEDLKHLASDELIIIVSHNVSGSHYGV